MFFFVNFLLIQPLKSKKKLPNRKYQLKNKYPPLDTIQLSHLCFSHFCGMSLITPCAIFSLETPFASWQIGKINDQDSDSDWFIYCIDIWLLTLLFSLQYLSHAIEMTTNVYYTNLELFCFSFTQPFTHSKFYLPNPFFFGATPPPINNDRSLIK